VNVETPPPVYERIDSEIPFSVVCLSLVRNMDEDFNVYKKEIIKKIEKSPSDTLLIVLPEYCWRLTPPAEVFGFIEELKVSIPKELTLVLGTLEFTLNGKYTNNSIILHDGMLWYVPKTKILDTEVEAGLSAGKNPGVIVLPRFNLGVLVCADLWEGSFLNELVIKQKADIVAVPAWTSTSRGNRKYGRREWRSLATAKSLEYSVCVAVADHVINGKIMDVCNATIICSHADRRRMRKKGDINRWIFLLDLKKAKAAEQRWKARGLAPLASYMENET
jgi:predicted amidohydrolase